MKFSNMNFGVGITGSFCTLEKVMKALRVLIDEGAAITPILSYNVNDFDTKFGDSERWQAELRAIGCEKIIKTIQDAEPIGPGSLLDVMVIAPCSGNTLAKLANGITDTPVLMAAKAHLRNEKPLVLAIASNDALGINAKNIGMLLTQKDVYIVPFGQDSPQKKPHSLVSDLNLLPQTIENALQGMQIQPILLQF